MNVTLWRNRQYVRLIETFPQIIPDIDRDRPKFPGLVNSGGAPSPMMTSLGGSINPTSLFMPPSAGLGSHLPHHHSGNNPFSSNNHLHHNSGGSSSGGSRSAESSPTAASSGRECYNL